MSASIGNLQGRATHFTRLCVGWGLGEGAILLLGFWRFAQHLPCSQSLYPLPACYWHPSSCCPGGKSQHGWVCIHSKSIQTLSMDYPENPAVSPAAPTPTGFYSQKLWGFIFPALELWALQSGLGLGSQASKVTLLIFIQNTANVRLPVPQPRPPLPATLYLCTSPPVSTTPALLPVWMNVASLYPWLSDFHAAQFPNRSGYFFEIEL